MQSAFVEIGLERAAFLHIADVHVNGGTSRGDHRRAAARRRRPPPIERIVFEGQSLTVQVIKDPIGTKGARLSTQISIAGRLLVFLPQDDHIGISQKIGSHELREQLRTRMTALAQADAAARAAGGRRGVERGGFILRTNAAEASDAELADDIAYLRTTWARVKERAFKSPPGTLLHQDLSLAERVLRDLADERTQTIRIDSRMQFERSAQFGREYTPGAVGKLQHYAGERPIFDLFNIDEEIDKALLRRVDLKSGGYLIIDQTEALTTVDVNTGGFVGARNFDDTIFKTNLEAGQAIARQLRLRNLGGIIIIDFIDMAREEHQAAVLAELKKQLARDRTRITVSGFTQLGLVEMTQEAHARVARPHAVRAVPDLPRPRRGEDGAQRLPRHPARDPARGAPVQPEGVPRHRLGGGRRDAARRGEPAPRRPVGLHRQADLAARRALPLARAVRHRPAMSSCAGSSTPPPLRPHPRRRARARSATCC